MPLTIERASAITASTSTGITQGPVTGSTLTLTAPVLGGAARDATSYVLTNLGADYAVGGGDDSVVPVTPYYTDGATSISLGLASALPDGAYQLRVLSGTSGLVNPHGVPLDGNNDGSSGDDFVTTFVVDTTPPVASGASISNSRPGVPTFQGLGFLPGQTAESHTLDISADGTVVAGYSANSYGYWEAFRWSQVDGIQKLGTFPGGSKATMAQGVSADGTYIVGYWDDYSDYTRKAFRWSKTTGLSDLGDLPGGDVSGYGQGISADGQVVVGSGTTAKGSEAFRWTQSGGMVGLGNLPGTSAQSYAWGVSADGSRVVGLATTSAGSEGFLWTAAQGMIGLGNLPGGDKYSRAFHISADGSTIVGDSHSANGSEAFRWTQSGGMVGLGDLPGGAFESLATDTTADGSVIVGRGSTSSGYEAFIWDRVNGVPTSTLRLRNAGVDLGGWTLNLARSISDDGRTITGYGTDPSGKSEAWVVTVPDPLLLGLTLMSVDFSDRGGIDPATVTATGNYSLVGSGGDGIFGNGNDVSYPITAASFTAGTGGQGRAVLRAAPVLPDELYQLTINGTSGMKDLAGNKLNGGSNSVSDTAPRHLPGHRGARPDRRLGFGPCRTPTTSPT